MQPPKLNIPRGTSGTLRLIVQLPDGSVPDLTEEGTDIEAWWAVRNRPNLRYALTPPGPSIRALSIDPANTACILVPYSTDDTLLMPTGGVEVELKLSLPSGQVVKQRFQPASITETYFNA